MKKQNIFIAALRPAPKPRQTIRLPWLYLLEAGCMAMLGVLWTAWNPVGAVLAYLLGTRLINFRSRRYFADRPRIAYRMVIDSLGGIEIITLSLIYGLNNFEKLGRLIQPDFAPDETTVSFSLVLLLGLTVLVTTYLVLRTYFGLKKHQPQNPWSENWFDKAVGWLGKVKSLAVRLVQPGAGFNLHSFTELQAREKVLVVIRGLIFPVGILAPFFLLHNEYRFCSFGGSCLNQHGNGPVQNILILAFILLMIGISLLRVRPSNHRALKRFAYWQILVSLGAFGFTLLAYKLMYPASQGGGNEIVMVVDNSVIILNRARFGLGLSPDMVAGLSGLYLLLPAVRWYRVLFSRRYIDGVKKQELFQ